METEYFDLLQKDWNTLLDAAIVHFKYPRISLDYDREKQEFYEDLGNSELQILGNYMKLEWLRRNIATWDNVRQLYNYKDFSQAHFLEELNSTEQKTYKSCRLLVDNYSRAVNYKPNKIFSQLAGKK